MSSSRLGRYLFIEKGGPQKGWYFGFPQELPKAAHKQPQAFSSFLSSSQLTLGLRVVCPLRGPGKPPGRKSPENGEKLQNSTPRSDPQEWGKLQKNCTFGVIFTLFWGNFPGGRTGEGNFVIFPQFSVISRWLPRGSSKGKNNS